METDFAALFNALAGAPLAIAIVLFAAAFLALKVWPWLTGDYLPNRRAHELELLRLQEQVGRHLENQAVALAAFAAAIDRLCERLEDVLRQHLSAPP